nr:PREDICTED: protein NRT1/ PTR FAMILY 4.5-like [Daucus carota subsp. sativus]
MMMIYMLLWFSGLTSLDTTAFIVCIVTMFLYFMRVMYFDLAGAANTMTNFMGSSFLLSLVGGFISDTYINRFYTCLIFGCVEVLAFALMTVQANLKSLHPSNCRTTNCVELGNCKRSSCLEGSIAFMFYVSLCLLALGSGGVRGSLPSLGADQFDSNDPKEAKLLGRYFNWLLLSTTSGSIIGVTVIVKISLTYGWWWGFFLSTLLCFIGFSVLSLGASFYRLQIPGDSPIIQVLRVLVAAFRNRKLSLSENADELYESKEEATLAPKLSHTNQFSWLDKAAIYRAEGTTPWTLCTVTQVEEVKILTRMMPILFSTIIMNTCLAQLQTFSLAQGNIMDLRLGSYKFPAASIPVIPLLFISILLPFYEFIFVPFARKISGHPSGITQLQRVGVGLVLSAVSMAVAGLVEVKRRNQSLLDPKNPISLFWLSFQYGIFGIADMFTFVGLLEFFYREAPVGMRSLSTSFTYISLSFGYYLSSVFVDIINSVTEKITPSKLGWLHGLDLNKNNLNLFYWFLAILSCINFLNYLYWATWYKYKVEETDAKAAIDVDSSKGQDDVGKLKVEAQEEFAKTKNESQDPRTTSEAEKDGSSHTNGGQEDASKLKNEERDGLETTKEATSVGL